MRSRWKEINSFLCEENKLLTLCSWLKQFMSQADFSESCFCCLLKFRRKINPICTTYLVSFSCIKLIQIQWSFTTNYYIAWKISLKKKQWLHGFWRYRFWPAIGCLIVSDQILRYQRPHHLVLISMTLQVTLVEISRFLPQGLFLEK